MNLHLFIIGVIVFAIAAFVLTRILGKGTAKSRRSLEGISRQFYDNTSEESVLLEEKRIDRIGNAFARVPILGGLSKRLALSGYRLNFGIYLIIGVIFIGVVGYALGSLLNQMYPVGIFMAAVIFYIISNTAFGQRINKREEYYLTNFPDAVDMIVRSVKSGQPLLSALKMIAQSATEPLASDVQRVIDEVSYGRPLPEALRGMADRVGFLDMNFFVVILSVQQETGGNLSEVLGNLANIIRKRKQLRLKIKALTAQAKMTTLIFSAIPFFQMGAVYAMKPDYLRPFWTQDAGVYMLLVGLSCIALAIFLGRRISRIEV